MGKSKASVTVAEVTEADELREFQQQQMFDQLHEFSETVTMMNLRQDDLQHHISDLQQALADLSVGRVRQEQFQQTVIEELRSLRTQPTNQNVSQIPIGSIPVSLGSTPFSTLHTNLPQPTWGNSLSHPPTHPHPALRQDPPPPPTPHHPYIHFPLPLPVTPPPAIFLMLLEVPLYSRRHQIPVPPTFTHLLPPPSMARNI